MAEKRTKRTKREPVKQEKSGEVTKLKAQLRREKKKNAKLVAEMKTLERAFRDMEKFLKDETRNIPLETLVRGAAAEKPLRKIKEDNEYECKKCGSTDVHVGDLSHCKLLICRTCSEVEKVV